MKRIFSVITVAAVMVALLASTLPVWAQSVGPICQLFLTDGEAGYYLHSDDGGPGYYDAVYGWHMWCQSPASPDGWYVQS